MLHTEKQTDRQTNKQINAGKNMTSLAEVIRVKHRMWSYESESAHILLFKILSLISRIKKKLCIHHECEVFLYQIVDGYKVIRKIHNDAKKSFENAVYSENFWVSEVDRYLSELGRTFFLYKFMEFLKKFRPQNAR